MSASTLPRRTIQSSLRQPAFRPSQLSKFIVLDGSVNDRVIGIARFDKGVSEDATAVFLGREKLDLALRCTKKGYKIL